MQRERHIGVLAIKCRPFTVILVVKQAVSVSVDTKFYATTLPTNANKSNVSKASRIIYNMTVWALAASSTVKDNNNQPHQTHALNIVRLAISRDKRKEKC